MNYSYLILLFFPLLSYSQSVEEIQSYSNNEILELVLEDSVITSHYTIDQIQQVYSTDVSKLYSIYAYYHVSFSLEPMQTGRETVENKRFIQNFDISRYEHLREIDSSFQRDFEKQGLKLVILSHEDWIDMKKQINKTINSKK